MKFLIITTYWIVRLIRSHSSGALKNKLEGDDKRVAKIPQKLGVVIKQEELWVSCALVVCNILSPHLFVYNHNKQESAFL